MVFFNVCLTVISLIVVLRECRHADSIVQFMDNQIFNVHHKTLTKLIISEQKKIFMYSNWMQNKASKQEVKQEAMQFLAL